jgi:hypothetical protein
VALCASRDGVSIPISRTTPAATANILVFIFSASARFLLRASFHCSYFTAASRRLLPELL